MKEFMKKHSVFIGQNRYCVYFHYHAKGTGHTACFVMPVVVSAVKVAVIAGVILLIKCGIRKIKSK